MVEYRWIKMYLFLILPLQFEGAAARQLLLSFIGRTGDDVTLPCENVIDDQDNCDSTTWLYSGLRNTAAVELITLGTIARGAETKSDRLSVTENCSLVIKKVTVEDVGRYTCRQFDKSGQQQGQDAVVIVSVVIMTEQTDTDKVTLGCSVWTHEQCTHKVKWLFNSKDVDKSNTAFLTSQSSCTATLTFLTSHYSYLSRHKLFKCEVSDGNKDQQFTFTLQPPGEDTITATAQSTIATTELSTENSIKTGATTTVSVINSDLTTQKDWWWLYTAVFLVLVALVIVAVILWKRTKEKKTRMNNKVDLTSKPADTQSAPETSHNMADPEDGVSYASISFTKNNSETQVRSKNVDDESNSATYTTVKRSSIDPNNLYASIK